MCSAAVCMLGVWPGRGLWLCFPLWLRAGESGVRLGGGPDMGLFILVGLGRSFFCLLLGPPGFGCWFSFAQVFRWCCSAPRGSPGVGRNTFLSNPHLCFIIVFVCDLFVSHGGPLLGWKAFARTEQLCVLSHGGGWGRGWVPVEPVWAP